MIALLGLWQATAGAMPDGRMVWEATLGDGASYYRLESVDASRYEEILVAAIADPPDGAALAANELWLWRLDSNGDVLCEARVQPPEPVLEARRAGEPLFSENLLVSLLPDGRSICVVGFGEGRPWLLHLDPGGRVLSSRGLLASPRLAAFTRLVELEPDGHLLLGYEVVGAGGTRALAMRLHAEGAVEELGIDRPGLTRFLDGAILGEDLFAVAAAETDGEAILYWLVRFGREGRGSDARPFPSQHLQVEAFEGELLLLLDGMPDKPGAWLQAVAPDLDNVWARQVSSDPAGLKAPDLVAGDRVLVVTDTDERLHVTAVERGGERRAVFREETATVSGERAITTLPTGELIVATTIYPKTAHGFRGRVRCACIRMPAESGELNDDK